MRQFFITLLAVIIGGFLFMFLLFLLLIGIGAAAGAAMSGADKTDISGNTVLTLDLRGSLQDHSGGESLFGDTPKESGKFIISHSQGFEATSVIPYMAITASDEIWQQDTTGFAAAGLNSETGFYGGVFEKYGARAEFVQFHEYKNAANIYTKSDYTDAHREATTSYLTSLYDTAVDHIALDREISVEKVNALLNASPHSAETALEAGLIDKLGHYVDAERAAKEKAGGENAKLVSVKKYGPGISVTGDVIAFIGGQGGVMMGESQDGSNPFASGLSMGGDTLSKAFIKAAEDKKVKAIVFRVSSPGGSATASDQIHDAVEIAKDAGKPIVISMGQYAASGGYYVAANADKIVAMPTTITGSIGVLGGKLALEDTFARIGYNVEGITVGGEYANAYSGAICRLNVCKKLQKAASGQVSKQKRSALSMSLAAS